jgi:kumamolisin
MGVGGTMLKQSGTSVEEVTWAEEPASPDLRGCATGGGVSQRFQRPAWQKNIHIASLNPVSIDGRVVPDVSALAGEPYYYLVFVGFPWPDGKTSASAPVWAALIARINAKLPLHKRRRFLTPLLYKKLTKGRTVGEVSFRDITIGSNAVYPDPKKGYKAGPGFDAVTGWGVPDGKKLLNCLKVI